MKREIKFDILKAIGLLCIILAHVNPPSIIFQLRNFDVVLMILISAFLGIKTYKKNGGVQYIFKRFNRLVLPTWIFITIFYLIIYMAHILFGFQLFGVKQIIGTYALSNNSIGYVWVIRIYFIIALLVLLYKKITNHINEKYMMWISLILFIIYEIMCNFGLFNNFYIQYLFAYFIPCFFLLCLSKYIFDDNNKYKIIIGIISLITLIISGFLIYKQTGQIQPTQIMKYPFRTYYLSYGILISVILAFIVNSKFIKKIFDNKITNFISSHSLWMYLWHILFIYVLKLINIPWYLKYILLIVFAMLITYIQSIIVDKLEKKYNFKLLKIFKG